MFIWVKTPSLSRRIASLAAKKFYGLGSRS